MSTFLSLNKIWIGMLAPSMAWSIPSVNYPNSLQSHGLCPKFYFPRTSESTDTRRWFPGTTTLLLSTLSATTPSLILIVSITSTASKLHFCFVTKITDQQLEKAVCCRQSQKRSIGMILRLNIGYWLKTFLFRSYVVMVFIHHNVVKWMLCIGSK